MQTTASSFLKKFLQALFVFLLSVTITKAQTNGCTDPAANNYDSTATINNGSCTYDNVSVSPVLNAQLTTVVNETSGLLNWNKQIWTHNDSGNPPDLYSLDKNTGDTLKTIHITNATNKDWEDIAEDDKFFYIGDFGNNANGNRTDLKIYRIKKGDLKTKTYVTASVINFSYNDQTDFTATGSNHTNFDCEAMIAYGDSLFLFSKDWVDNKTRLYKLPKLPGTYTAENIAELNVQGLITGAEILPDKRVIALTGYNSGISPFVYLLYDFTGNKFFDANKRKVAINQSLLQMEGICSINQNKFYVSNEKLFTTSAKLQTINLTSLLKPYYAKSPQTIPAVTSPKSNTGHQKIYTSAY